MILDIWTRIAQQGLDRVTRPDALCPPPYAVPGSSDSSR